MIKDFDFYLASQSPRRYELLSQVSLSFETLSIDIDESVLASETPQDYVARLAKEKAFAGYAIRVNNVPVLGADTSVVIDGQILGKPKDADDAERMLGLLSGKSHQVMTAVSLVYQDVNSSNVELRSTLCVSDVSFKVLTKDEITDYVSTGESMDKAGSYAIQGKAAAFITHLSGSYSGVMGLPLYETIELLNNAPISIDSLVVS